MLYIINNLSSIAHDYCIEVMVIGDETVEKVDFPEKVVGIISDFMATLWGHGNDFVRLYGNSAKVSCTHITSTKYPDPRMNIF